MAFVILIERRSREVHDRRRGRLRQPDVQIAHFAALGARRTSGR